MNESRCLLAQFRVRSVYLDRVKEAQLRDSELQKIYAQVQLGTTEEFKVDIEGMLRMSNRVCVPKVDDLQKEVMEEAHYSPYSVHPGATKMYHDLKSMYWWSGMKKDIADFVSSEIGTSETLWVIAAVAHS